MPTEHTETRLCAHFKWSQPDVEQSRAQPDGSYLSPVVLARRGERAVHEPVVDRLVLVRRDEEAIAAVVRHVVAQACADTTAGQALSFPLTKRFVKKNGRCQAKVCLRPASYSTGFQMVAWLCSAVWICTAVWICSAVWLWLRRVVSLPKRRGWMTLSCASGPASRSSEWISLVSVEPESAKRKRPERLLPTDSQNCSSFSSNSSCGPRSRAQLFPGPFQRFGRSEEQGARLT